MSKSEIIQTKQETINSDREICMVLLVDDDPFVAEAMRAMIDGEVDINFHYCPDPCNAVSVAEKIRPTVILLDMVMPDVDGLTVLRYLRASENSANIPVVALSSKEEAELKANVFLNGGNDYLIKLPDRTEMLARVRYHSQSYLNLLQRDEAYLALRLSQEALADSNLMLQRIALADGLTGIPNRRHFDEHLEIEWRHSARSRSWISVILIDIDMFKVCNDVYGHLTGDDYLCQVAKELEKHLMRPTDTVARYGGEEFVAILPETDSKGASQVAESMRAGVEALQLANEKSTVADVVTISLGVASIVPEHDVLPTSITESADKMLYQAKNNGRNRVQVIVIEDI